MTDHQQRHAVKQTGNLHFCITLSTKRRQIMSLDIYQNDPITIIHLVVVQKVRCFVFVPIQFRCYQINSNQRKCSCFVREIIACTSNKINNRKITRATPADVFKLVVKFPHNTHRDKWSVNRVLFNPLWRVIAKKSTLFSLFFDKSVSYRRQP